MTSLTLRPYQGECVYAVRYAWSQDNRTPVVVLPTGAGKTVIFSALPDKELLSLGRMLVLVHRIELLDQAVNKIRAANPGVRVGVMIGDRDEVGADIVVAMVQTLRHPKRLARLRNVRFIVVDECHHATAASYVSILEWYGVLGNEAGLKSRAEGRSAYAVGFTATLSRGDGAALGEVWSAPVYVKTIAEMIRGGFLVEPRGELVEVEDLDLSTVKSKRGGDYADGDLGRALSESLAPSRIVEAWQEHADNKQTILFAPTVAFAEIMSEAFVAEGVKASIVHGRMAADERREALRAFTDGETTVLCNCMVLTEGTDLPRAEVAVIARPTKHHGLWVQMIGRVLRLYPGKTGALVLDVVGASKRHSLLGVVDLVGEGAETRRTLVDEVDRVEDDEQVTLADELVREGEQVTVEYVDGNLKVTAVDLFHGSRAPWNQTEAGTWYLEASTGRGGTTRYLALVPSGLDGTYHVAEIAERRGGWTLRGVPGSAWVAVGVPSLEYAMSIAEADITWAEKGLANKGAAWRKGKATTAQQGKMYALGLQIIAGETAGDAGKRISRRLASARIDRNA